MIVVDTSAIVAIYLREPGAYHLYKTVSEASERILPPACMVEFALLHRLGGDPGAWIQTFVRVQEMHVIAFTADMAAVAADAAVRYGRGSNHPARLNFGDCLSYAVAKHLGAPLLYKGRDFTLTDIQSALTQ